MGSYLSRLGLSPGSPAQARTDLERPAHRRPARPLYHVHRIQHVHRAQPARRYRPVRSSPKRDPSNPSAFVNEAWRRFPMKRPQNSTMGPLPSDWWESYLKRNIWSLRHPRAVRTPVMVKVAPPEHRARPSFTAVVVINSAGPSEKPPPAAVACEKQTVLRTLWRCRKERGELEESLFPESLGCTRGTPEARRSAFKPLIKNTAIAAFVPRPGPLKRGHPSQSSGRSLKRPSGYPVAPVASTPMHGPLGTNRNAVRSSYSSRRHVSEPLGRRFLKALKIQEPAWPLTKRRENHSHALVPPASEAESPGTSRSSGQANQGGSRPLSGPGEQLSKSALLQRGSAVADEALAVGRPAGPPRSSGDRKDALVAAADAIPEARPPRSPISPSPETARTTGPRPQLGSSKEMLASPGLPSTGQDSATPRFPPEVPIPRAPLEGSQPEPLPGASSLSRATTASTPRAPGSPTSPVTDATRPSAPPKADRSATPPPPAPPVKSRVQVRGSVTPAVTTHPALKPTRDPPRAREVGGASYSRISAADSVSSSSSSATAPGIPRPAFTPVFGGTAPPPRSKPVPVPVPAGQPPLPATPVSPHGRQASARPSAARTAKDSARKPALELGVVKVANACRVAAACHPFPAGPPAGSRPPRARPAVRPTVRSVTVFRHVLVSAAQMAPLGGTARWKGAASGLAPPKQPAAAPGPSSLTSACTPPLGSGPKPTLPAAPEGASQPARGAVRGRGKPGLSQPAVAPSFNSALLAKSSIASPAPRPVLGGWTPPASTFQPGLSSTPMGSSFGEASSTGLEVAKQCHRQSGACGSVFGLTAPRPFAFGGLVTPMDCEEPETIVAGPHVLTSGAVLSGNTRLRAPLAEGWSQSVPSPSTSLASRKASFNRKTVSGAPPALGVPVYGPLKTGSSLGLGMSSPSAQGFAWKDPFRSRAPLFSVGAKPKPLRTREPGHSRRHHAYKK